MKFEKTKDLIAGGLLLVLGAFLFATSFSIPAGASMGLGPSFMPRLLSAVLAFFGGVILWGGVRNMRTPAAAKQEGQETSNYRAVVMTLVFLLAYIVCMKPVGFVISTAVYVTGQILLFSRGLEDGKKMRVKYVAIAVVSSVLVYAIFTKGFALKLPAGILG